VRSLRQCRGGHGFNNLRFPQGKVPGKYVSSSTTSLRGASSVDPFLPLSDERDHLQPSDSDSNLEDEGRMENEKTFKLSIPKEEEDGLLSL